MPVRLTRSATAPGVVVVTLDWPKHRNALDAARAEELAGVLTELWTDTGLRGAVLTGNGAYCSGGDLRFFREFVDPGRALSADARADEIREIIYAHFQGVIRALTNAPVPVVAAVDGLAIGFGLDLALACDVRFVSDAGWFLLGWERLGLIPGGGGLHRLVETCGTSFAWQLLADGRKISPADAASAGFAERCADTTAVAAAETFLDRLNRLPPATVAAYTSLLRPLRVAGLDAHLEQCLAAQQRLLLGPDFVRLAEQTLAGGARTAPTRGGTTP